MWSAHVVSTNECGVTIHLACTLPDFTSFLGGSLSRFARYARQKRGVTPTFAAAIIHAAPNRLARAYDLLRNKQFDGAVVSSRNFPAWRRVCDKLVGVVSPKAYIETTIVSYLTAWPSCDLSRCASASHARMVGHTLHFRTIYLAICGRRSRRGDPTAAAHRLSVLRDLALLDVTEDAILLAGDLVAGGGLPAKARVDALHVAMAAVHGMNFLLTWNCAHIANATTRGTIEEPCRTAGFEPPIICTPLELPMS